MKFLDALGPGFDITLFHYRNHGADYGRVLAGIAVPPAERARFDAAIEALGYPAPTRPRTRPIACSWTARRPPDRQLLTVSTETTSGVSRSLAAIASKLVRDSRTKVTVISSRFGSEAGRVVNWRTREARSP